MLEFIELEHAQDIILNSVSPTARETVTLQDSPGRVMADAYIAKINIPPFDRSPLDGYAIWGEDTLEGLPVKLRLVGEIPAGQTFAPGLKRGEAVRILTGSPLPTGANAVIRQEDTVETDGYVQVNSKVLPGESISLRGEDIKSGDLFSQGQALTPAAIGILASQGESHVTVHRKPMVSLISTGDELVLPGTPLGPGKIYNTNLYTLGAMLKTWGGEVKCMGISPDRAEDLAQLIAAGLQSAQLVVTTGGASVGKYDVTLEALKLIGAEILFWRVALKPGTPVICARLGGKLIIGLSGNPAAAMIGAALLLGPAVRKMAGFKAYYPKRASAVSNANFARSSGVRRMVRAIARVGCEGYTADFPGQQQPGVLKSMLHTNALLEIVPHSVLAQNQTCELILLDEWEDKDDTSHFCSGQV